MLVAILLGLVIGAALGALGGGGSILAVPVLVYVAGQSAHEATATSLVAVAAAAAVGLISHARARRVAWLPALAFAATGIGGSWVGSRLNDTIDPDVLLLGFSGLILVAAYRMLTACPSCTNVGEDEALAEVPTGTGTGAVAAGSPGGGEGAASATPVPAEGGGFTTYDLVEATDPRPGSSAEVLAEPAAAGRRPVDGVAVARVVVAGSVVGLLTGLFGVGGGFVIVPALTLALGMSMPIAIGTSLAVIVGNAMVALGFRGVDAVDWGVAVPFTATMLIGSLVGSSLSHRVPAKQSLTAFSVLLVAVALANGIAAAVALAT